MFGAKPLYTVVVCQDLGFTIMHSPTKDGAEGLFEGAIKSEQVECAAWYDSNFVLQNAYSRVAARLRPEGVPDDTPLEELEISRRLYNCLRCEGHETVGDVRRKMRDGGRYGTKGDAYLLTIPNFGRLCLQQWKEAVR